MIFDLTENEARVIQNELWLRLYMPDKSRGEPAGSYREWLQSALFKIESAFPQPPMFTDNH